MNVWVITLGPFFTCYNMFIPPFMPFFFFSGLLLGLEKEFEETVKRIKNIVDGV